MKIAILNMMGTVGKTTIAAHLLAPRMNNAPVFAIETLNEAADGLVGIEVERIAGNKFQKLIEKLILLDDAIIDVGASNVEGFLDGMIKHEDARLEFDCFIIPLTDGAKEQKETMSMVTVLSEFGIPADKIKLVFNKVKADVTEEFGLIMNYVKQHKNCIANPKAVIFENELFNMLSKKKMTIPEALADPTDYKAEARKLEKEIGEDGKDKNAKKKKRLH